MRRARKGPRALGRLRKSLRGGEGKGERERGRGREGEGERERGREGERERGSHFGSSRERFEVPAIHSARGGFFPLLSSSSKGSRHQNLRACCRYSAENLSCAARLLYDNGGKCEHLTDGVRTSDIVKKAFRFSTPGLGGGKHLLQDRELSAEVRDRKPRWRWKARQLPGNHRVAQSDSGRARNRSLTDL